MLLTCNCQQVDRSPLQTLDQQFIAEVDLLFLLFVNLADPFLQILQEELILLQRVGVVIGEINVLLNFNTKMKLELSIHLNSPHLLHSSLLVLYLLRPSFLFLAAHAHSVVLVKLLFLSYKAGTLAKYDRIFMRRMMMGIEVSHAVWMLK